MENITITHHPTGIYINEVKIDDTLAAAIVKRGRLVKVISETKVVIRPDINTPGLWRLPTSILQKIWH